MLALEKKKTKSWLKVTFGLATIALFLLAQPAAAEHPTIRGDVFQLQIQTDRTDYAPGNSILLRVVVRNNTNEFYSVPALPPCISVALSITDGEGNLVPRATPMCSHYANGFAGYRIPPGGKHTLESISGSRISEWTDLVEFGYTLHSGTYTISAIPMIDAFQAAQDGTRAKCFHTAEKPTSNVIRIRVH